MRIELLDREEIRRSVPILASTRRWWSIFRAGNEPCGPRTRKGRRACTDISRCRGNCGWEIERACLCQLAPSSSTSLTEPQENARSMQPETSVIERARALPLCLLNREFSQQRSLVLFRETFSPDCAFVSYHVRAGGKSYLSSIFSEPNKQLFPSFNKQRPSSF